MKYSLLISACCLLLFSGCSRMNIKADPVDQPVIHPPAPDQLQLRNVEWAVFNRENLEEFLKSFPNEEIAIFALSAKGYENLSLNMAELTRYLKEQKGIIIYYRKTFPNAPVQEEGGETQE